MKGGGKGRGGARESMEAVALVWGKALCLLAFCSARLQMDGQNGRGDGGVMDTGQLEQNGIS